MMSVVALVAGVAVAAPVHLTVKDGYLNPGNEWVGTYTSMLQENVIGKYYKNASRGDLENVSEVNATVVQVLELEGAYYADKPLHLPSMFQLRLGKTSSISRAANLSLDAAIKYSALVEIRGVYFTSVVGGTYDATGFPPGNTYGYAAISMVDGQYHSVRGIRALANNSNGIVNLHACPHCELAHSDLGGGDGNMLHTRCVWLLTTSKAIVHDNHIHHCASHSLDLDAYTSTSSVYSNLCEYNGEEGIFVEETASNNFVFNNTCRYNNGGGIGVYSNAVGPVAHNTFINNVLIGNKGNGLNAGGRGGVPTKTSLQNTFVGNYATGNGQSITGGFQYNVNHGLVSGDYWTGNEVGSGDPKYANVKNNFSAVVIYDP